MYKGANLCKYGGQPSCLKLYWLINSVKFDSQIVSLHTWNAFEDLSLSFWMLALNKFD